MRIMMTGATGFIGSRVAARLLARGHSLVAAVRTEVAAERIRAMAGEAEAIIAPLREVTALSALAADSDGVIHLGFEHGPDLVAAVEQDRRVIAGFVAALAGSGKPLIASSATGIIGDTGGALVDEDHPSPPGYPPAVRRMPENDILEAAQRGVRACAIRVANLVHSAAGGGPISRLLALAQRTGASRYIGTGENHLPCVHLDDLADLYILALESAPSGRIYNGNGGEVRMCDFAAALGTAAGVPVESIGREAALAHFGPFAGMIFALDIRPSNARARTELGWQPYRTTRSLTEDVAGLARDTGQQTGAGLRH